MELFVDFVLPNVLLFGGIVVLSKLFEYSVWWVIENYDSLEKLIDPFGK